MPELLENALPEVVKLEADMVPVPGRNFSICRYEVTQALWQILMTATLTPNPSKFKGPDLPVENVSWENWQTFCIKLNSLPIVNLRGQL